MEGQPQGLTHPLAEKVRCQQWSQHKVAAGGGTGAWHGDALGEEDAPVPVLLKRQTLKRFEPWRQADTAACARQWSCTMGSLEVLRMVLRGRTGDHSTNLLYHENKKH